MRSAMHGAAALLALAHCAQVVGSPKQAAAEEDSGPPAEEGGYESADDAGVWQDPKDWNKHIDPCSHTTACDYERKCAMDTNCDKKCDVIDGSKEDKPQPMCMHKNLSPDFSGRDMGAIICVFFGCMLAASAGIGGGGLFVPIYMLINGFLIQEAIPLSHATVMGNSVAQLIVNFPLVHDNHNYVTTEKKKPVIDYSVPLLLLPGQLGGNNLGVLLYPIFPPNILIILAELLLGFATFRVLEKGLKMWKNENLTIEAQPLLDQPNQEPNDPQTGMPLQRGNTGMSNRSIASVARSENSIGAAYVGLEKELPEDEDDFGLSPQEAYDKLVKEGKAEEIEEFKAVEEAETTIPKEYIGFMFVFWLVFAGAYVGMAKSEKCHATWLGIFLALYPVLFVVTLVGLRLVKAHAARRKAIGVKAPAGEVVWTEQKAIIGPVAALFVGLVAGLLGLGGGELMAPLLLELGLMPKASSSTSAYMIIWTTSSNMVHYAAEGALPPGYAICFCLLGFLGGGLGRYLAINFVAQATCLGVKGRQSPIAFFLGAVLGLSMVLMAYKAAVTKSDNAWWPFSSMC